MICRLQGICRKDVASGCIHGHLFQGLHAFKRCSGVRNEGTHSSHGAALEEIGTNAGAIEVHSLEHDSALLLRGAELPCGDPRAALVDDCLKHLQRWG